MTQQTQHRQEPAAQPTVPDLFGGAQPGVRPKNKMAARHIRRVYQPERTGAVAKLAAFLKEHAKPAYLRGPRTMGHYRAYKNLYWFIYGHITDEARSIAKYYEGGMNEPDVFHSSEYFHYLFLKLRDDEDPWRLLDVFLLFFKQVDYTSYRTNGFSIRNVQRMARTMRERAESGKVARSSSQRSVYRALASSEEAALLESQPRVRMSAGSDEPTEHAAVVSKTPYSRLAVVEGCGGKHNAFDVDENMTKEEWDEEYFKSLV